MAKSEVQPEVIEEAEVSYETDRETIEGLKNFLIDKGVIWKPKAQGSKKYPTTYWDTDKFKLLAQKIELRTKENGKAFTHDLKIPVSKKKACKETDPTIRQRYEIKARRQNTHAPKLKTFRNVPVLKPIWKRAAELLEKKPRARALTRFKSYVGTRSIGGGQIEYKIDVGYFSDPKDQSKRSQVFYLFEIEHISGKRAALNKAMTEIEAAFKEENFEIQKRPKIILAYDNLVEHNSLEKEQLVAYKAARKNFTRSPFPLPKN